MATVTATGNGNWSSTTPGAPWPGGIPPAPGDTVESGGFTVTVDQDITVALLTNTAGGGFAVTSARAITGNIVAVAAKCVQCSHSTGILSITGNVYGGSVANASGVYCGGTPGNIVVTGNVTGGSASAAHGVHHNWTGLVTVTGTTTGGSVSTAYGIRTEVTAVCFAVVSAAGTGVSAGASARIVSAVYGAANVLPVTGYVLWISNAANSITVNLYGGGTMTLSVSSAAPRIGSAMVRGV